MPKKHRGIEKDKNRNTWSIHTTITLPDGMSKHLRKRGFLSEREAYDELEYTRNKMLKEFEERKTFVSWNSLCKQYWEKYSTTVKNTTAYNVKLTFDKHILHPNSSKSIFFVLSKNALMQFRKYVNDYNDLNHANKNRLIKTMKSVLTFAYENGFVGPDVFQQGNNVLTPLGNNVEIQKEKVTWSQEQYQAFLATFNQTDKYLVFFELFGHLGCRVGEIRGLQVKHWNKEKKEIYICQQASNRLGSGRSIIVPPKTLKSTRMVQISDRINNLLIQYVNDLKLKSNDYLFFDKTPTGTTSIRRVFLEHSKMAMLPIMTIHGIRHSNTTWLLSSPNLSLNEISIISQRLGHASKKMTLDIYYHLTSRNQDGVIKVLK